MAAKRQNLAEVFKEKENEAKRPSTPDIGEAAKEMTPQEKERVSRASAVAPSRQNKKHIGGYFDESVYRQLKFIGVEEGMTTQQMLSEALNAFFERYNKPPIA